MRRPLGLTHPAKHGHANAATNYSTVYKALAYFIIFTRRSGFRAQITPTTPGIPPLSIVAIPTTKSIRLPLPYMPSSDQEILTCHLSKMATKQFLEDGEWVGCRCEDHGPGPVRMYPDLIDINFLIKARKRRGAFGLSVRNARDERGYFDLNGVFYADVGRLYMTKTYHSEAEQKWTMLLAITPFGLVGSWSILIHGRASSICGWLWLWKRSWRSDRR